MENNLKNSILELIIRTSSTLSDDVFQKVKEAFASENKGSEAHYAMDVIFKNIELAKINKLPLCQDTGTISFYITHGKAFDRVHFEESVKEAIVDATSRGILRQNSVDSITGVNTGNNLGSGHPQFFYELESGDNLSVTLMLKGGGCENIGAQYALPQTKLKAERDLLGVKKVVLDAVIKAQGKGCGPGFLGVCVGGDRASSLGFAKKQLLRNLDDKNEIKELEDLEKEILEISNSLGIGPMGFGGKNTLLGVKIGALNRLPASFFVSISYMCWANRRQGVKLKRNFEIDSYLY